MLALFALAFSSSPSSADSDLHLSLTGPGTNPVAGSGSPFTIVRIRVTNDSGNDVGSYTARITLPAGISLDSSSDCAVDSSDPQIVDCVRSIGIANGASPPDTFSFDATASPGAAGSFEPHDRTDGHHPGRYSCTSDPLPLTVDRQDDLTPSISGPSPQTAGDTSGFDYTVGVHNGGPSDNAGGYTVTGTLPHGVTFVSGAGCTGTSGGFTCSTTDDLTVGGGDGTTRCT